MILGITGAFEVIILPNKTVLQFLQSLKSVKQCTTPNACHKY